MYINEETASESLRSYRYHMADLGFLKSSVKYSERFQKFISVFMLPDRNMIQLVEFSSVHSFYGKYR